MTLFRYTAFTEDGATLKGELEADNERALKRQLQTQGMFVTQVSRGEAVLSLGHLRQLSVKELMHIEIGGGRVKHAEIVAFSRQFATLVGAGLPVLASLDALIDQAGQTTLGRVLRKVRQDVNEGQALAVALEQHPKVFSNLYTNMVRAAETSGRLGPVLGELADLLEERQKLAGQVRAAMTYPVVMLVVGLGVVAFLLTSVVPNITGMFADTGQALPQITQIMLAISDGLQNYGLVLAIALVGSVFVFRQAVARSPGVARAWDKVRLRLPVYGPLSHKAARARFTATLAALLQSGVPIIAALRIARNITPFLPYQDALEDITVRVGEGAHLGEAMRDYPALFPSMIVNMVVVGEKSGKLDDMLARVSMSLAADLRAQLGGLTSLIQPLLLMLMGGLIAFIMGAVLLPIFELNTIAGGL